MPSTSVPVSEDSAHPEKTHRPVTPSNLRHEMSPPPSARSLAPPSPHTQHLERSPTASAGTDCTEFEEDRQPDQEPNVNARDRSSLSPQAVEWDADLSPSSLTKLDVDLPTRGIIGWEDAPNSVIHVPEGFRQFGTMAVHPDTKRAHHGDRRLTSPVTPDGAITLEDKQNVGAGAPDSAVGESTRDSTSSTRSSSDRSGSQSAPEQSSRSTHSDGASDVQVIDVTGDLLTEGIEVTVDVGDTNESRLRLALSECWTFCNTLEGLSSMSRRHAFKAASRTRLLETAWESCWQLCKDLYTHLEEPSVYVHQTIEQCRAFAKARFEARPDGDETEDSLLRVSFEMNCHLYNIRDRALPLPFIKRTMAFYVTFCHRMMKQRSSWSEGIDSLLCAGWSLAEALWNVQQAPRQGDSDKDELVISAIQACWELSDIFRHGWMLDRPERSTPRATQTGFPAKSKALLAVSGRASSLSNRTYHDASSFHNKEPPPPPETPITIFDDISVSDSPEVNNAPNIMVLGPDNATARATKGQASHHDRWSSNASSLSVYSGSVESSQRGSSTVTAKSAQAYNVQMLRVLIVLAAKKHGFQQSSSYFVQGANGKPSQASLQEFVRTLPRDTFGNSDSQLRVFDHYKALVVADASLRNIGHVLSKRYPVGHVAKAVKWLSQSDGQHWGWMGLLFEHVVGRKVDDPANSTRELDL